MLTSSPSRVPRSQPPSRWNSLRCERTRFVIGPPRWTARPAHRLSYHRGCDETDNAPRDKARMDWLIATIIYVGVHFILYLAVFREREAFTSERVIFAYHCVSFALLSTAFVAAVLIYRVTIADAATALGLHGLYSLSFLELWSLAEGSYSISILRQSAQFQCAELASNVAALERVGDVKRAQRTDGMQRLGLVRWREGRLELTAVGRLVLAGLRVIDWTANTNRIS
jgi:hypothetical protein